MSLTYVISPIFSVSPYPAPIGRSSTLDFTDVVAVIAIFLLICVVRSRRRLSFREKMARADALHLQTIIDAVPVPMFYKDLSGCYLGCNRAFEEVLGKSREEISGKTVYDVAPSDLAAVYHQADLELIASQGKQIYETKVLFADGMRHDIIFHKAVFRDPAGMVCGMVGSMLDISEQKRTEQNLLQSEDRYRAFIAMSTEGIWRGDISPPVAVTMPVDDQVAAFIENLRIAECNDALARIYGFTAATEIVGRRTREFYDIDQVQDVLEKFVTNGYTLNDYETRQYDRHGGEIWISSTLVGVVENGQVSRLWGTRRDITEKKRQLDALEYNANHDSLTGLPNRFYLKNRLEAELAMLDDHGQLALFILDLDRFKEVNDTLGHHAGDLLLVEFAKRLQQVLTGLGGDIARLGGDEFAIIYTRVRSERDVFWLAELMLRTMHSPFDIEGIKVEIEGSIGIALAPVHGRSTSSLLRCADVAMYRAKKVMKRYCIYSREHDPYTPERLALINDLGRAVRSNELVLFYQPKVDLKSGDLAGFEALVRWSHPTNGLLLPGEFIPYAEISELIVPITYQIIEKAIGQLRSWQTEGIDTTIACNLSARLLMDDDLSYHVEAFLARYGVNPAALELEITETALIAEPERAREILGRIHSMGVRLSIDDFGTGYSSLAMLKSLPLNALKIDLLFVSQMLRSEQDAIIVSSTINLAHNLGLKVVAEGVECRETLDRLREIGCDQAQGYFIGLPMCAETTGQWIEDKRWREFAVQ
ncbi:MAG TPA: EAL domain-containing protein [Geobacteraceae bacterium]|nr:EAL domain-containing protein [Geobacteraceae bacterium]